MQQQHMDVDPLATFGSDSFVRVNGCSIDSPDMPWTCQFKAEDAEAPCGHVNTIGIGFCEKCCSNRFQPNAGSGTSWRHASFYGIL